VTQVASIVLTGLTVLIASSGAAFAGVAAVPEPATLTLLAAGVGVLAAVKYLGKK
jgi:hypothetical protein